MANQTPVATVTELPAPVVNRLRVCAFENDYKAHELAAIKQILLFVANHSECNTPFGFLPEPIVAYMEENFIIPPQGPLGKEMLMESERGILPELVVKAAAFDMAWARTRAVDYAKALGLR